MFHPVLALRTLLKNEVHYFNLIFNINFKWTILKSPVKNTKTTQINSKISQKLTKFRLRQIGSIFIRGENTILLFFRGDFNMNHFKSLNFKRNNA